MTSVLPYSLPRLLMKVKYRPRKIAHPVTKTAEGRLLVLRRYLTELIKHERIELPRARADETRQYTERLLQLAIQYGDENKHVMDMADYWLEEKDLIPKLFQVLVPRFVNSTVSYTRMFRLPAIYYQADYNPKRWHYRDMSVLELRGNPFPPVITKYEVHHGSLLNILLSEARKKHLIQKNRKTQIPTDITDAV